MPTGTRFWAIVVRRNMHAVPRLSEQAVRLWSAFDSAWFCAVWPQGHEIGGNHGEQLRMGCHSGRT